MSIQHLQLNRLEDFHAQALYFPKGDLKNVQLELISLKLNGGGPRQGARHSAFNLALLSTTGSIFSMRTINSLTLELASSSWPLS